MSRSQKEEAELRSKLQEQTEDCTRVATKSLEEFNQLKAQKQAMETDLQGDYICLWPILDQHSCKEHNNTWVTLCCHTALQLQR